MDDRVLAGLVIAGAYFLGSIPFGLVLARARGVDIRGVGSGNIGATNVARNLGKRLGLVVLLLDALKGIVPMLVLSWLDLAARVHPLVLTACGVAAIAGHCFPVWLRFRGGKGVATALGVFLAVDPALVGLAAAVFAAVYAFFRIVSVGSLAAALSFLALQWLFQRPPAELALGIAVTAIIVLKHRGNIGRLIRREEHRV
jgi:acyl phosphate:glycerol-3-phosphate acyltransferase